METTELPPRRRTSLVRAQLGRSYDDMDSVPGGTPLRSLRLSSGTIEQDLAVLKEEEGSDATATSMKGGKSSSASAHKRDRSSVIYDSPAIVSGYASVPKLEVTELPRGGISIQTKAVGAVQFGIPPETIKDSMRLGLEVPRVFIVPVERFCREIGPALGINLAEFEYVFTISDCLPSAGSLGRRRHCD
jgi:hypothetical protein